MGDNWQGRRKEIRGKKKERKEGGRGVGKEEGREREKERQKGRKDIAGEQGGLREVGGSGGSCYV